MIMKGILGFLGGLFGIGKQYIKDRQETKRLEVKQRHEIIKAETDAVVNRIKSNTQSDNEIDLITARNKRYTLKDEIITYIFLVPIAVATIVPFIVAWENGDWLNLNTHIRESYFSLDKLPQWYKWVLFAVVVDVLGFRSFARKLVDKWLCKKDEK